MKKTIKYIFAFVIGCMVFTSCEDPYANQTVAKPGSYDQLTLQDTTGFAAALKTGVSPLIIPANKLDQPLALLTCSSVLNLVDTAARTQYKIQFSNVASFVPFITIPITFDGKAGSDVTVACKQFNDSIKTFNKNAVQQTVYIRLLSYIVKGGLKSVYTSKTATLLVTPNNYAPTAINDIASLPMNSSVNINVIGNDTDPEKDVLTVSAVGSASHGVVTINTNGTVKYTPTTDYSGADSFSYTISDGNGNTATANVDVTVMSTVPYTAVTLRPWYIIGLGGHWDNSVNGLGSSLIPLSVIAGNNYNSAGDGTYTYTGYFKASDGFKILRNVGDWNNDLWGMTGSTYVHNGGDNISVPTDGYYTITLNSITNNLSISPALVVPTTYTSIDMPGGYNGWSISNYMTLNSTTNHTWYYTLTLTAESQLKFRANADPNWTVNWGPTSSTDGDPLYSAAGIGALGGKNIVEKTGTYVVMFNDISGCYYFYKK